jgi:hypothetical protein
MGLETAQSQTPSLIANIRDSVGGRGERKEEASVLLLRLGKGAFMREIRLRSRKWIIFLDTICLFKFIVYDYFWRADMGKKITSR